MRHTIVVRPGRSIQAAIDRARRGDTVFVSRGVYRQQLVIRKDGITLRGAGNSRRGTVLLPPGRPFHNVCTSPFGPTGVCIVSAHMSFQSGRVFRPVRNDTVTGMYIAGFASNGVFGYGTVGMKVTHVTAVNDGNYGISRFASTRSVFSHDVAIGNGEAGFYVGDSPRADALIADNIAVGSQFGVFIRHARGVAVTRNRVSGNCQGVLVLDDGQRGGAGNTVIWRNTVFANNKFCPRRAETLVALRGGGILLLGATGSRVVNNHVFANVGHELNSGGILIASARRLTHGANPNFDVVVHNFAHHNAPADLIWDGTGVGVTIADNHCGTSAPPGLCW